MRKYIYSGGKRIEIALREQWLQSRLGTDVLFQDWEMYSWGDFRHHCSHETPDQIAETRANVSGTIFHRSNLVCRDCTTLMPEEVKNYFYSTLRLVTMNSNPPTEFYIGNMNFRPGVDIKLHSSTPTIKIV